MCSPLALASRPYGVQSRIGVGLCFPSFYHVSVRHVAREIQQAEPEYKPSARDQKTQTARKQLSKSPHKLLPDAGVATQAE